jgi:hypothetical protein
MPFEFSDEDKETRQLLFRVCKTKEELQSWCYLILDIELPDATVDPLSNSNPLDMVWTCYNHIVHGNEDEDVSRYLFYASRFGGKTLCESIIEVMLLLHSRGDITHLAAIERQSRDAQKYIAKFYNLPALKGILSGDSKKEKIATFFVPNNKTPYLTEAEWKVLPEEEQSEYTRVSNTVEVIVATLASTNGKHSALLCLDEVDVMGNTEAYEEAKNIPTPTYRPDGSLGMPLTILTSTRKFAFGLVQSEINNAEKTGLIIKNWNILDICEKCPKKRHQPELPKEQVCISEELLSTITLEAYEELLPKEKEKYQKIECFGGCLKNCKILPACKTYLATRQTSTSKFLKPVSYVQNQIKTNNIDKCLTQLLCRKPSTEGLIYPTLSKEKHMITPARAYELICGEKNGNDRLPKREFVQWVRSQGDWCGGLDWGYTHLFAYVQGIKIRNVLYVTHVFAASELDPSQQIDQMERFKEFEPKVWADTEDPALRKTFKRAGWRMPAWVKGPGSIAGGISSVKLKLMPTLGRNPEVYFVRDVNEDPMMDLLFLHLREHHYKLDAAGKPTDLPSDDNKDLPDAFRYLIQNEFDLKGSYSISSEEQKEEKVRDIHGQPVYFKDTWMVQKISELTNDEYRPSQSNRPPMAIEDLGAGYYAEQNKSGKDGEKGKFRGLVWDLV